MAALRRREAGLRAIALYKTVKASVELSVVLLAIALWPFGLPALLHELTFGVQQHATSGWALSLSRALAGSVSTSRGIELGLMALGGDGALTGIEAWALQRGHWWGPWLVVLATGALLPFELFELVKKPHLSRLLLLAANAAIVVYLARRARRERSEPSL